MKGKKYMEEKDNGLYMNFDNNDFNFVFFFAILCDQTLKRIGKNI